MADVMHQGLISSYARNVFRSRAICFALAMMCSFARADVKLPAMFTEHAVLQRDMPVPVWGWAEPGEDVKVSLARQTETTKADDNGKWRVTLKPLSVGESLTL